MVVDNILTKSVNEYWALVAQYVGNGCPNLVQSMPEACSLIAQGLFTERTAVGDFTSSLL